MNKSTKIWLIAASTVILLGIIIFGGAMSVLKWDFTKLSTNTFETNNYEINEEFSDISIYADTADIKLVSSENQKCSVVCYEQSNIKHSVSVEDGTLVIKNADTRKWYEYIGINFSTPKITLYLPQGEYGVLIIRSSTGDAEISKEFIFESIDISASTGDVSNYASASGFIKIKTTTGNIRVEDLSADTLSLSVSTGRVTSSNINCAENFDVSVSTGKTSISGVKCKNLYSSGNTGDISLKQVVAEEKFSIERTTGDVTFDGCDAMEIFIKTDTGDVKGTLLSDKVFVSKTDTGRIDVPNSITGGKCEITTDTGNIKISKVQENAWHIVN